MLLAIETIIMIKLEMCIIRSEDGIFESLLGVEKKSRRIAELILKVT